MFHGLITLVYTNIYQYIQKVNSSGKFFLIFFSGRPSRPLLCILRPSIFGRQQHPAPRPGVPAPGRRRGRFGASIARPPSTSAAIKLAALPLAPRGSFRKRSPCVVTLSENRAALALAWIYKFWCWSCAAVARSIRKEDRTRLRGRARPPGPRPAISVAGFSARPQQAVTPAPPCRRYKRGCNRIRRARRAPVRGTA